MKGGIIITILHLKEAMAPNFNINEDYKLRKFDFDFMAEFILKNEKYFLSKKNVVWGYENREYVLVKKIETMTQDDVYEIQTIAENAMDEFVNLTENHMSTHITVFIQSSNIDDNIKNNIKNISIKKSYMWGIKGWSDVRVIVFDCINKNFTFNKASKEIINFYKEVLL
ncbi:hypothetical protein [Tepidibacter hydrothermalis]|uniref:DUF8052 domain-containing protein n=1 Tax=Tepidibacter hydrothermalis TaxID=3036126 RepID=A0ABY8EB57_9FIRM|nr:hypothetical protein [Tepidibacter hydrothermalis]WFD10151.1 hypothetical protein P4S50_17600 [Tepidibacter hydrothermalis]